MVRSRSATRRPTGPSRVAGSRLPFGPLLIRSLSGFCARATVGAGTRPRPPSHHEDVKTPVMIDLSATQVTPAERDLLAERRVAGVCLFGRNVVDRFQVSDYVAELRSLAGADLIVAIDQEGGGVLRLR